MADIARLTIDLNALAHNYRVLRGQAGATEVAPVVKADAYGLGASPVARRLWREGARSFFVARRAEGEVLREALGAEATIHVLDGCSPGAAGRLIAADLVPVLNSLEQVAEFAAAAPPDEPPPRAALHVDTGMSRLGLRKEEARGLAADPTPLAGLALDLLVSHYACADEPDHAMNRVQATEFAHLRTLFPRARASLANSGGVFGGYGPMYDLARPGISLYGGGPFGVPDPRLRAVATLEAPILQVRDVRAGETVGYSATFTAERPMRIAVIAGGYADGVLRAPGRERWVWFDNERRRLLGRISMDLIALDVTGSAGARPGAMVEIVGTNLPLDEAAAAAGTISYECLTRMSSRAERVYLG